MPWLCAINCNPFAVEESWLLTNSNSISKDAETFLWLKVHPNVVWQSACQFFGHVLFSSKLLSHPFAQKKMKTRNKLLSFSQEYSNFPFFSCSTIARLSNNKCLLKIHEKGAFVISIQKECFFPASYRFWIMYPLQKVFDKYRTEMSYKTVQISVLSRSCKVFLGSSA